MTNTFRPWQLLSVIIAGMLNEQQQQIIEHLKEENRILRAQIGNRCLRLSDDDRRRLAAKGNALGLTGGHLWSWIDGLHAACHVPLATIGVDATADDAHHVVIHRRRNLAAQVSR